MKAVVAAFNQEKALVGAFSVITNLRMELFEALSAPTWNDRLVIEVPAELGLGLGVHDPLEEDLDPLLHGVALDLGDEPGGAPLLGLDGEGARGRPLGYPVHPGTGEMHQ